MNCIDNISEIANRSGRASGFTSNRITVIDQRSRNSNPIYREENKNSFKKYDKKTNSFLDLYLKAGEYKHLLKHLNRR